MCCDFGRTQSTYPDNRALRIIKFYQRPSDAAQHSEKFPDFQPLIMALRREFPISLSNANTAIGAAYEFCQIKVKLTNRIVDASHSVMLVGPAGNVFVKGSYQPHLGFWR